MTQEPDSFVIPTKISQLVWKCDVCGWIGGVNEMVPETYECPVCGAFNDVHVMISLSKPVMTYVIA